MGKDLEQLYGQKYKVIATKREIRMDLPLQIGVAVYHLAKLRMLYFYYNFFDKYIDRSDFELLEMDTVIISLFQKIILINSSNHICEKNMKRIN